MRGDGEGDGDGDVDGDGEDRVGADDRCVAGDVLWPAAGLSAGDVALLGAPDAGAGLRPGEDRPPGALGVPNLPPPSATVEAWAWCVPPATSNAVIPAAMTATPTAATPAAIRGCRRTSYHHRRPGGTTGFGNPVRPNGPARCVTLTRWARPVGVLSAPAFRTRSRRPLGGLISASAPSGADRAAPAASPADPS